MPRFWIPAEFNRRKPPAVAFSEKAVLGRMTCLELEFEIELELRTWVVRSDVDATSSATKHPALTNGDNPRSLSRVRLRIRST